jgi:hypothetical protein
MVQVLYKQILGVQKTELVPLLWRLCRQLVFFHRPKKFGSSGDSRGSKVPLDAVVGWLKFP